MATDVEIGSNVARVRGAMSQKGLADAMRERGFRWSQATVWAIEKGERPLRLSEAEAVGRILGIHHTIFLSTTAQIDIVFQFRALGNILDEIEDLAFSSFEQQRRVAQAVDWQPSEWDEDDSSLAVISRTAVDAAIEGILRAEANYRALREVNAFADGDDDVPSAGKYSDAFMNSVKERIADERVRIRAARAKEEGDGVDQTA